MLDLNEALKPQNRDQRGKFTFTDLGVAANVKTMSPELLAKAGGKFIVGYIIGHSNGTVERSSPDGTQKFEGLSGNFIGIPADGREQIESGVLFIPDSFHNIIADSLAKRQETTPNATIDFAIEVAAVPAKNPAGYSWVLKSMAPPAETHPLDTGMKVFAEYMKKALPAPQAVPDAKAAGGKK
jgi:hypothetical protein